MPIKVACQCGQQFVAKDQLAGKQARCPKCGTVLTIPQPRVAGQAGSGKHLSDLLDDVGLRAGLRRCPGCGAEMSPAAVICVMCGFDTRLGRRLKTLAGSAIEIDDEDLGELPTHGVEALDRAERQIALDKLEQKRLITGAPWWMLFLALLGLVGFAVGMVLMPQESVMINSGIALQIGGGFISFLYGLRILIVAFKESVLQGLLYLIVPFYSLFYIITRWDRVAGLFILMLVGNAVIGLGFVLQALSPMLQPAPEDGRAMLELPPRTAIVMVFQDTSLI